MSQTPTPSDLLEIRRVKAMVAGAGNTINPQCFLGPQGPPGAQGPQGPRGAALTVSTITTNNAILYYTTSEGILGSPLFTFTSSVSGAVTINLQGNLQTSGVDADYIQINQQTSIPFLSTGVLWYNSNTGSLFVDSQNYSPTNILGSNLSYLVSSITGLGSVNYISTPALVSTVEGLGNSGYLTSYALDSNFVSSITGLGSSGYISSAGGSIDTSLTSSLQGIGSVGYISSFDLTSTLQGLGSELYISSSGLQSTLEGLGSSGYISSAGGSIDTSLTSSLQGIGSVGYISSFDLTSTLQGLGSELYISSSGLQSTLEGLGSSGYISSAGGSIDTSLTSSLQGIGSVGYISSFDLASTLQGLGSEGYISTQSLQSSLVGATSNTVSTIIGLGSRGYVSTSFLLNDIASTIQGLGSELYISSSGLQSTLEGLGTDGYISSQTLQSSLVGITDGLESSIVGLGSYGYISSIGESIGTSLTSTLQGIGSSGYVSSFDLTSTLQGMGSVGYISSIGGTIDDSLTSTVQGLGSDGYISTLSNVTMVSTLTLRAGNISANTITASTIYARAFSTHSLTVWGTNTLTVQGNTFACNVNLLNDTVDEYIPLTVANGSLALNTIQLAPNYSVLNSMFSMNLTQAYSAPYEIPNNYNYYFNFQQDQNTFTFCNTIADPPPGIPYVMVTEQSFQSIIQSCSMDLAFGGRTVAPGIFGVYMGSNYDPLHGFYNFSERVVYFTVAYNSPNPKQLQGWSHDPLTGGNPPILQFTKDYNPTDTMTITMQSVINSNQITPTNYVMYTMLVNGSNYHTGYILSNLPMTSNYNSNTFMYDFNINYTQIPFFGLFLSNLSGGDVYRNIIFSGTDTYISPTSVMASATVNPYISSPLFYDIRLPDLSNPATIETLSNYQGTLYFNDEGIVGPDNIFQSYLNSSITGLASAGYPSTPSLANGLFSLVIPTSVSGNFETNSSQNTLKCTTSQDIVTIITSGEAYDNVFFSCKANISDNGSNSKFGLINTDNNTQFAYNFCRFGGQLCINNYGTPQSVKTWNSNDILSISLTRTLSNAYTLEYISFFVNGVIRLSSSNIGATYDKYTAAFTYFNTNDKYSDIIFSGSYGGYPSSLTTSVFPTSFTNSLSPTYSNVNLIDNYNEFNVLPLSNYQSTLYFNGSNLGGVISQEILTSSIQGLGSQLTSTVEGLGSQGYVSSFDLASTVQGLGSLGYVSTAASLNNALFSLVIPDAISPGTILLNSATNSLYAANNNQNQTDIVTSVEAYNNVFFTCKANIIDTSQNTRIGLVDSNNNFIHYFYNNNGTLTIYDGSSVIKSWNSNDVLAISITNFASSQAINYYVNGSNAYSNVIYDTAYPYRAGFTYFNQGDSYINIVFSGSYEIMQSPNTSVFLTAYPFTQSPIYSTLQLIDTNDSANVLVLSNYQSNLYFNGVNIVPQTPTLYVTEQFCVAGFGSNVAYSYDGIKWINSVSGTTFFASSSLLS